jgi:hypothetical protein
MTGGRPLADWTATLAAVPDMTGAKCAGIPGFTEAPVNEQLAVCWSGNHCPVIHQCRELGLATMPTDDERIVYGGMRPVDRIEAIRERRRQERRAQRKKVSQ